jgi:hypothetical protein
LANASRQAPGTSSSSFSSKARVRVRDDAFRRDLAPIVEDHARGAPLLHRDTRDARAGADLDAEGLACLRIACVIAPMPPIACPQVPFLPFTRRRRVQQQ